MICICLWHIKTWEILDFTMKFNHVQPSAEAGCHWAFVKPRCRFGLLGLEADAQTGGWLRCPRRRQLRSCVRHPCWWWLVRSYWPTLHTSNLREHHNPLISIIHGNEYSMHHIPLISPIDLLLEGGCVCHASGVCELDAVAPGCGAGIHRDFAGLVEGEGLRRGWKFGSWGSSPVKWGLERNGKLVNYSKHGGWFRFGKEFGPLGPVNSWTSEATSG